MCRDDSEHEVQHTVHVGAMVWRKLEGVEEKTGMAGGVPCANLGSLRIVLDRTMGVHELRVAGRYDPIIKEDPK